MTELHTPLIATITAGLVFAFAFGLLAHRLRVEPIVGYLLAGVVVGPHTPGFIADQALAVELSEIGVMLLMFGVGLHFSLKDLAAVARIAVPGALGRMFAVTVLSAVSAWLFGWSIGAGVVFGLAVSVASTVVLVRALQDRRLLSSEAGRIAVGWLIVEDLAVILVLVLLPPLAGAMSGGPPSWDQIARTLGVTLAQLGGFIVVMLVVGPRVIPWLIHYAARTRSRELFRLAVYAIALGVATAAAKLFGVSFALGAFFAGVLLGETKLSQRATEEAMPLRDAFAVLFFVSVGMLFNPAVVVERPAGIVATLAVIVLGKSAVAYLIVRAFGYDKSNAIVIAACLAQIGEFSFVLVGLGVVLDIVPEAARDLIVAGAVGSIMVNPLLVSLAQRTVGPAKRAPP